MTGLDNVVSGNVSIVKESKKLMPIGTTAERAGISRQSLQYYLMVGLLEATEVTSTGRRMFDAKAVARIKLIRKLNKSGYPLRAIRELFLEGGLDSKGTAR
jgi:DNA-binding transcriptional MerR regulator